MNKKHHTTQPNCKICNNLVKMDYTKQQWRIYCSPYCAKLDKQSQLDKGKETNLERYGVKNVFQAKDIQEKQKQSMLNRYGVEYSGQSIELSNKRKETCLEKYSVENPQQNKEIREKTKQTTIEKYGCHFNQKHIVDILPLIQNYEWLFDQYITQNKTATQIASELGCLDANIICKYLRKVGVKIRYNYSYSINCIKWLEQLIRIENISIQHALNEGEYQIPGTKLKADGYCQETNTIYEFYGDYWHGNPLKYHSNRLNITLNKSMGELYQKTIEREHLIKSLGYNLITIWESDFN